MKDSSLVTRNDSSNMNLSLGGVTGEVRIHSQFGLHARPAAQLVKLAQQYSCEIRLKTASGEADAKSILDILSLAAGPGVKIRIHADGADEKEALETMIRFLSKS